MSAWSSLIDIPELLQGKIITKLEWKSYFRMQQTCRNIMELVQNSSNIKVFIDGEYGTQWREESDGSILFYIQRRLEPSYPIPYGVQFETLNIRYDAIGERLEALCDVLKTHRITSYNVKTSSTFLTTEDYVLLMKTLKVTHVKLNNYKINQYAALFQLETLKEINIDMFAGPETNVSNTVSEVEKLLSVTECLMLNWISNGKLNDDDFDSILIAILELLDSDQFPQLLKLKYNGAHRRAGKRTLEESLGTLRAFNPTHSETCLIPGFGGMKTVFDCLLGNSQSHCKVIFGQFFAEIEYEKVASVL